MTSVPLLEIENLTKKFGNNTALNDVSFDLMAGEVHALVGENGAGKSTMMRVLAGIYSEFDGEYSKNGTPINPENPAEALTLGIGMIHQELSVIPELSVAENLCLGCLPKTKMGLVDWNTLNRNAHTQLDSLGFGDIRVAAALETYPLGFQQVVEILRTVNSGAEIIIMDEPTSALSPQEIEVLIKLIANLKSEGRSIVYISHFIDEVLRVSDRITVLRDSCLVATLDRGETNADDLISLILGRAVSMSLPDPIERVNHHAVIEARGLSSDAFEDISFTIGAGEIVGLFGVIGAGHFDVAKALFGMYDLDTGRIIVNGHELKRNFNSVEAVRQGLAYATESRRQGLFLDNAIYKNISLPHIKLICGARPSLPKELLAAEAGVKRTGVYPPDPMADVGNLSGGNQQKVAIARWLTVPPKVLIVSEPTRGMDVGAKSEVLSILLDLRNQGVAVLVASSEPETILSVSDRVVTMARGEITDEAANDGLEQQNLMKMVSR